MTRLIVYVPRDNPICLSTHQGRNQMVGIMQKIVSDVPSHKKMFALSLNIFSLVLVNSAITIVEEMAYHWADDKPLA